MTSPAKLRIMDKVQAYAEIYALVGSKLDNGSASADAKRIKLEIESKSQWPSSISVVTR